MTRATQAASDPARAEDSFTRAAIALEAQRPLRNARLKQIASLIADGRLPAAEKELNGFLAKRPDDADALSLLARIYVRYGRRRDAIPLLVRCLEIAPDFAAARFNYAFILYHLNRYAAALEQLDELTRQDPHNPLYRQLKANVFEVSGENEQSLALCKSLALENPTRAESWVSYGHALRAVGAQEESIAAYRKAIACRPSHAEAWWSLANMKAARFGQAEIAAMEEQLRRGDLRAEDRMQMEFALGKAYEDVGDYSRSYEHYAKGAAAKRLRIEYDPKTLSDGVARNKALFTPEFLKSRAGAGCKARDPIFVLGRPRSGSTLIEQILSSHSMIEGTAELPYITTLAAQLDGREGSSYAVTYLNTLAAMDPAELTALGEQYMEDTRIHRKTDRPFFIDKKPGNFPHLGLIHLILPNAKIIDARRNPAACSFSMFKHYSSKGRISLAELGLFYRDYLELMEHFDKVLPGRVHRVIYENMVADPEKEVRGLLDYLELPFEESCLRFYETKRTVLTPSSEQVRRPISGEAVEYWRNFEPWLGPLLRSLGSALTEYPNVPEELR
ncbi:MAG TPA: sulfotransferase [Rhizomicrobium sp.]|nr:sulfotransferase [Rhizomicrobium sp.]